MTCTSTYQYLGMERNTLPSIDRPPPPRGAIMAAADDKAPRSSSLPFLGLFNPFLPSSSSCTRCIAFISSRQWLAGGQVETGTGSTDMAMMDCDPSGVSTYRMRTRATKSTPHRSWHCTDSERSARHERTNDDHAPTRRASIGEYQGLCGQLHA